MTVETSSETRLATDEIDLLAAQRLRYRVFVEELGGDGPLVDHLNRLERDEFDPVVDQMLLIDNRRPRDLAGSCRRRLSAAAGRPRQGIPGAFIATTNMT